jgi:hypothetical protein
MMEIKWDQGQLWQRRWNKIDKIYKKHWEEFNPKIMK